jgi:hypothetical protein
MPRQLKDRISFAVILERGAVLVEGEAVKLNHQTLPWPIGVDLEAGDDYIGGGEGQAASAAEGDEAALQLGAGLWNGVG